jgi:hypothetical protein
MDKIWNALNADVNWSNIKDLGAIFLGIGGILVSVGSVLYKIRSYGKRISATENSISDLSKDMRRRLFDADSQPIYMPLAGCRESRDERDKLRAKENTEIHKKLDLLIGMHLKNAHVVEIVEDRREEERRKEQRRLGKEIRIVCNADEDEEEGRNV